MATPAYKNTNTFTVAVPNSSGTTVNVDPQWYIVGSNFAVYTADLGFVLANADYTQLTDPEHIAYIEDNAQTQTSGWSGHSGYSGISGANGTNGTSGYSGAVGTSGYSGAGAFAVSGYGTSGTFTAGYSGAGAGRTLWLGFV